LVIGGWPLVIVCSPPELHFPTPNQTIHTMPDPELLPLPDDNRCGEAPIWDAQNNRLLWTDIGASIVYAHHPGATTRSIISQGLPVSGIALNRDGRLVFAGATGLHLFRAPGDHKTILSERAGETLLFNDILADPSGRIYAGTVYWDDNGMQHPGKLYLIDRHGSERVVEQGIELSNGLAFSPDDRTLYYADSGARSIWSYEVDPGSGLLSHRRLFARVPGDEGIPDGLAVDSEGFLWCAQWYGGQVVRYDPDGRVNRRVPLPVRQVASLNFGGPDLLDLYITTAAENWPSALAPPGYDYTTGKFGGGIYRLRLEVPGKPEHLADLE
jgi:sugar lactone lactonase YvrE